MFRLIPTFKSNSKRSELKNLRFNLNTKIQFLTNIEKSYKLYPGVWKSGITIILMMMMMS